MNLTRRKTFVQKLVLVMLMISGPMVLKAQTGAAAAPSDTSGTYLTPMEYAFMMHEEPKFMLRLPAVGLGAEFMILPGLSFVGQADYLNASIWTEPRVTGELRYYLKKDDKVNKHLSGNYIAIGAWKSLPFWVNGVAPVSTENSAYATYVKFGMQRRVFGNGLVDLGLISGWVKRSYVDSESLINSISYLSISSQAQIGLGLVFSSSKDVDWTRMCPVTRCYDVERFMLKVNFANALNYRFYPNQSGHELWINPKISMEQKVLHSAFSVNAHVAYNLGISSTGMEKLTLQSNWQYLDLQLEGRYYYNLKRRMLRGKSGNGLSGNYFAAGARQRRFGADGLHETSVLEPYIATGIQRTLGKRFYIDVNIGLVRERVVPSNKPMIFPIGDMQIGFRF